MSKAPYIRIGELSRRVGVSPELLRAWERRYGLLQPGRSAGRFRLYSDADVARIRAMQANLERGVAAAEAARLALEVSGAAQVASVESDARERGLVERSLEELRDALDAFDDGGANRVFDRVLAAFALDTVLREVVLPALRDVGERWARNEITVAQEHFASNVLRGRLLALGRGWGNGTGPRAILAAPPGELHDLGLVVFGLALRDRGWRITFLGADTPLATLVDAAERISPELVVVAAVTPERLRSAGEELASLARSQRLAIAGAGSGPQLAEELGAEYIGAGPVDAADLVGPPVV